MPIHARCRSTLDAVATYERLGSPEGELALAEAVIYLACAAEEQRGLHRLQRGARAHRRGRFAPGAAAPAQRADETDEGLGYGKGYRYAHDEPEAYAAGEHYLPDGMPPTRFYAPTDRGLEAKIRDKLDALRAMDRAATHDDDNGDG